MKTIRVLIIDDERIAIEVIRELIHHFVPDLVIAGTATDGMDAVEKIASLEPDLVFIDVDMPYINGVEVVQTLSQQGFYTIFTTGFGFGEFTTFSNDSVDYLLKPIDPADFVAAVAKARSKIMGRAS